jgi:hypothetical protein
MTTTFDMNVIPPTSRAIQASKDFYGFANFPINGSKFFKLKDEKAGVLAAKLTSCARQKNKGAKFITRILLEGGENGVRIWRIS